MWLQLFGGGLPCQLGHLESSKKTVEPAQNKGSITFNIFTPFDEGMVFSYSNISKSFFGRSSRQAMHR